MSVPSDIDVLRDRVCLSRLDNDTSTVLVRSVVFRRGIDRERGREVA